MELCNRFMRSATHDGTADDSGAVTEKSISVYRTLGDGSIGLIVSGYAFVSASGQALKGQYGAHTDEMIPGLKRMAEAVHSGGGKIALQIVHAGMMSPFLRDRGITCLAPSKIEDSEFPHREMTADEVGAIIGDFGSAAARSREAGFDAVQLHGAHGYLMTQFLSPLMNTRGDKWGGSPENRRRFHIEVMKKVRLQVGDDFPLLMKLGVMDDVPGGTTLLEGIATAMEIAAAGVDAIEVSAGIPSADMLQRKIGKESTPENEQPYFRGRAASLKLVVPTPVAVVEGIRSFDMAQAILNNGEADIISMSRPFIREPKLVKRWSAGDRRPARCITCNQCLNLAMQGQAVYCWQEFHSKKASLL